MAIAPRKTVLGPDGTAESAEGADAFVPVAAPAPPVVAPAVVKPAAVPPAPKAVAPVPAPVAVQAAKAPTAYRVKEEATISLGGAMATFRKGQILRPEFFGPGRFEQVLASCSNSLEPVE